MSLFDLGMDGSSSRVLIGRNFAAVAEALIILLCFVISFLFGVDPVREAGLRDVKYPRVPQVGGRQGIAPPN